MVQSRAVLLHLLSVTLGRWDFLQLESVTPVVLLLYEEGITALVLRLLDSKITPGSLLIGPGSAPKIPMASRCLARINVQIL